MSNHAFALYRNKSRTRFNYIITRNIDAMLIDSDQTGYRIRTTHEYINISTYHYHLSNWYKRFPRQQILILDSAELMYHPSQCLQRVEHFLGVEPYLTDDLFHFNRQKGFYCYIREKAEVCMSAAKGLPHAELNRGTLHLLKWYFKPHNERFYNISGLKLNW